MCRRHIVVLALLMVGFAVAGWGFWDLYLHIIVKLENVRESLADLIGFGSMSSFENAPSFSIGVAKLIVGLVIATTGIVYKRITRKPSKPKV